MRAASEWTWKAAKTVVGLVLFLGLQVLIAQAIDKGRSSLVLVAYISIVGLMIILWRPYVAVVSWLILSPWLAVFARSFVGSGAISLTFDGLVLPILGITLLLRALKNRHQFKPLALGECLMLLSVVYSDIVPLLITHYSASEYFGNVAALARTPIAIYFITKACFREEKQLAWVQYAFIAMGLLWAATGWYEHYTGKMWLSSIIGFDVQLQYHDVGDGTGRARGPADHLYAYGAANILCALIAYHLAGCAKSTFARLFYYGSAAFIVVGLFFTFSRAPYLAFCVAALLMPFMARTERKRYVAAAVLVFAVVVLGAGTLLQNPAFRDRMENRTNFNDRMAMNKTALNIIRHNFWFGVRKSRLDSLLPQYVTQMRAGSTFDRYTKKRVYVLPHNEYLVTWASEGLLGVVLHFGGLIFLLRRVGWARSVIPQDDVIRQGFLAVTIAFVFACFVLMTSGEFQGARYLYSLIMVPLAMSVRMGELRVEAQQADEDADQAARPKALLDGRVGAAT